MWFLLKSKLKKQNIKREGGFSLIEVVLIIIIMGISILPITKLTLTNIKGTVNALDMTRSLYYARMLMEIVIVDYNSPDVGTGGVGGLTNVRSNWDGYYSSSDVEGLTGSVSVTAGTVINGIVCADVIVVVNDDDTDIRVQMQTMIVD